MTASGSSRAGKTDPATVPVGAVGSGTVELELLYRNEQRSIIRFFTRYPASRNDAQDLAQEAFLRMARVDLEAPGRLLRPAAYLRKIARHLLFDRAKAARRHHESDHVDASDVKLRAADEQGRLEARDSLTRLQGAIDSLKPRTREVFLAYHIEGLSYAQIAERTGLAVSSVEKQMGRAFDEIHRLTGLP